MARWLLLVFTSALLAGAIAGAAFLINQRTDINDALENMSAISTLKATQIETWLAERQGDIESLSTSSGFGERVLNFRSTGSIRDQQLIENRLQSLRRAFGYESVQILDEGGQPLISLGRPHGLPPETTELFASAFLSGEMLRTDIVRDRSGDLHIDAVIPLRNEDRSPGAPKALVLLHVNPEQYLFPAIKSWPTASPSGETLLVRRDGDSVVFLNTPRHSANPPLALKLSVTGADKLPAAVAVTAQQPGTIEGVDYRGVPVLAAYRRVKGTEWSIIAKVDQQEVIGRTQISAALTGAFSFAGLLVVGVLIRRLVRAQRAAARSRFEAENARLFRLFFELPFIGMAITSAETKRWVRFNDELCRILGYTREEMQQLSWTEMTHPEDLDKDVAEFNRVLRGESEGYTMDKRFIRKDGGIADATIDVRCERKPDGTVDYFVATVQDISARKASERAILRLSQLYAALSHCNEAIIRSNNEQQLLSEICTSFIDSGAIRMSWIGMTDPAGRVRPVAYAGAGTDYLTDIEITLDADDPHGQGPTARSIREDRAFWCQDFQNDPATAPWHERGAKFGWGASASIPIHRSGKAVGALTAYAAEPHAFDEQVQGLMTEIAANVGYALDGIDRDAARSAAEKALGESEEHYRLLVEASPDAILLVSPERTVLSANAAAGKIFHCKPEELVGLARKDLLDVSDPRTELVSDSLRRTGVFRGELINIRRDGEKFPTETSIVVLNDGRDANRLSLIIRDITERKQSEARILAQLDELRRWHEVMLGREERVLELKAEINEVLGAAGLPPRYPSAEIGTVGKTRNSRN